MHSQPLVIKTANGRALAQPAMIILDRPGLFSTLERLLGDAAVSRVLAAVLMGSLVGSLLHHLLGVGAALVVTVLFIPLLAGTITLQLAAQKEEAQRLQGLQQAAKSVVCAPLAVLSGSLLGALSLIVWGVAAAAVYSLLHR